MICKYKEEQELLYTYENDIHILENNINSFKTGLKISPSLNQDNLINIINYLNIDLNNKSILDIGCGHGLVSLSLAKRFDCKVTSVDFSKKRIDRCNLLKDKFNINNVNFINNDINIFLEKEYNKYDIVIAFEVIEHLYNQREVINEIKYITKEYFFGTIPIQPNCQQKQHISYFKSYSHAKDILKCTDIITQDKIKLRLPECVVFYYDLR